MIQAQPGFEFEMALQRYIKAVTEYKLAMRDLVEAIGPERADIILRHATNRICYADNSIVVFMSQEEIAERAKAAQPMVDSTLEVQS